MLFIAYEIFTHEKLLTKIAGKFWGIKYNLEN
jgi:hypothetical protein